MRKRVNISSILWQILNFFFSIEISICAGNLGVLEAGAPAPGDGVGGARVVGGAVRHHVDGERRGAVCLFVFQTMIEKHLGELIVPPLVNYIG